MKKFVLMLLCVCALTFVADAAEFLVVVDDAAAYRGIAALNAVANRGAAALNSSAASRSTILEHLGMIIVETDDSEVVQKLSKVEGVKAVSKARMVYATAPAPNDPGFAGQWYHPSVGTLAGWDTTRGDTSIVVAVCDTGVDYTHEDIKNSMWTGGSNSGNSNQYGFSAYGSNPMDGHGHGTHVSGTIAATVDNGLGGVGMAPNVKIMAVKVLNDSGSGYNTDIAKGINYVIGQKRAGVNVRIANFSLGSGPTDFYDKADFAVYKSLSEAGILIMSAAGNDNNDNDRMGVYPASYGLANQITMGATGQYSGGSENAKTAEWGSNYGKSSVHIFSPGTSIYSALPVKKYSTGYGSWSGTSMATPLAAGVAAMVWSVNLNLKASDVKKILLESGTLAPNLSGLCKTGMVVNAEKAVAMAKTATPSPDDPKEPDKPVDPDPTNPDNPPVDLNPIRDNKDYVGNNYKVKYQGNVLTYESRLDGDFDSEHILLYAQDLKSGYQILGGSYNHDRFGIVAEFRAGYYTVTVRFWDGFMMSDTTYLWSVPMLKDGIFLYLPIKITRKADLNLFGTDSGCSAGSSLAWFLILLPGAVIFMRKRKKV